MSKKGRFVILRGKYRGKLILLLSLAFLKDMELVSAATLAESDLIPILVFEQEDDEVTESLIEKAEKAVAESATENEDDTAKLDDGIVTDDEANETVQEDDENDNNDSEYEECTIATEPKSVETVTYDIPEYSGMKKWMDYRKFKKNTLQYELQQYAVTDSFGFREVNGCYCVAIGSRFNTEIGQRFDLVLKNGTVIPCVMADQKADAHTDATNTFSILNKNKCCSEFVVSDKYLESTVKKSGDVSSIAKMWESPVDKIVTYNINMLDELKGEEVND